MLAARRNSLPKFNSSHALGMYVKEEIPDLCELFLKVLGYFHQNIFFNLNLKESQYINEFIKTFLFVFTQPNFIPPDKYAQAFIQMNHVISNLVAITPFKNTDVQLNLLRCQKFNLSRLLTLYSSRNTVQLDLNKFFDSDARLASLWYCMYASNYYGGLSDRNVCENLKRLYTFEHPHLDPQWDIQELYFGSTYLDGISDRMVKQRVNAAVKNSSAKMPPIYNTPQSGKIGVFSAMWMPNHSVFRNYSAFLQQLRRRYELTLFKINRNFPYDDSLFHHVHTADNLNKLMELSAFRENQFQLFYFPDIGMSSDSIIMSNRRIAPVQICSLGHSVSTFGADIDYFISGRDVEVPIHPEQNYSERLVLLPGMGVIHNRPMYTPQQRKKHTREIIINCSWFAQKINYAFVQVLRELLDNLQRPIKLRVFLGYSSARQNDHIPFVAGLVEQLGQENLEFYAGLNYPEYMSLMEEGDLSIESYHFGGCNTVSDSLYLGIPIVTWEGDRWYNRIGSQMLRLVNLSDLIATNKSEYIAKITSLVHDDSKRQKMRKRLLKVDLDKTIYNTEDAKYFEKAVDYLIANHPRLQKEGKRDPIIIE